MDLKLKISKQGICTTEDVVNEEYTLRYGHIFRGRDGKNGINGKDGKDGTNGKDGENGITPRLKVESGYMYISYDNGLSWKKLSKHSTYPIVDATHSELTQLRDSKQLVAGAFYRITDYECSTTQIDTRCANHPFDIIVQALDSSTLSENAQAIQHEGDTYFANANLPSWKLKYCIDNDTSRFAWAQVEVAEREQSWISNWGVLESKPNSEASTNYLTAVVDGRTKYLYAPANRGTYLDDKNFYRNIITGSITSPNGFIYEADNPPIDWGEGEWNWDDVTEMRVKTADGKLVTTLYHDYENYFYDENDGMQEYSIQFSPYYTEVDGVYRFTPEGGVEDWWEYVYGGVIDSYDKEYYTGSKSALYYAFNSILSKYGTYVKEVYSTETGQVYSQEDDDDIDYVSYTSYIAPKAGGKGVIFRMIDEHNNDCPFDFKNIQFKNNGVWYYTFSFNGNDISLTDWCRENYIAPYRVGNSDWDDTTTIVPYKIPMMVFNCRPHATNGKTTGINNIKLFAMVKKGYMSAPRLENFEWRPQLGGTIGAVSNIFINLTGIMYGNTITGACTTFSVGTLTEPANTFYANDIALPSDQNGIFTCLCSTFVGNKLDLAHASAGFTIKANSVTSCRIESTGYIRNEGSESISFGAETILRNVDVRMNDNLDITYANSTSSTSPLRFVSIDARGWGDSAITIPSTFPTNATYELKVAKNSAGDIKMWCDADLVN